MDITHTATSTAASIRAHTPNDVPDWVETLARLGYAAKGVVYAAVGVLALQAAFSVEQIAGSRGALLEIAQDEERRPVPREPSDDERMRPDT